MADKEKGREEAKVQAAKAKVQEAKAEDNQRKKLHIKRVPSAYVLFVTDHFKKESHVPSAQRFKVSQGSLHPCNRYAASQCCDG